MNARAPRPVLYALLVLVSISASATAQSGLPTVASAKVGLPAVASGWWPFHPEAAVEAISRTAAAVARASGSERATRTARLRAVGASARPPSFSGGARRRSGARESV